MQMVEYDHSCASAWDAFASRHPDATFYHQIAWRDVISRVYGLRPHYVLCVDKDEVAGIAPLFEMRDLSWQRTLVSLPFSNYGGILASSSSAGAMLLQEVSRRKELCGAKYAVLKRQYAAHGDGANVIVSQVYCSPHIELTDCDEAMFRRLPGKTRNQVRKAVKCGASVKVGGESVRQDFVNLYYDNMSRFGTPCHRRTWFKEVAETFGERCLYLAVHVEERPVAAAMLLLFVDAHPAARCILCGGTCNVCQCVLVLERDY